VKESPGKSSKRAGAAVKKIALIEKANPAWVDLSRDWYDLEPADLKRATDRMDV
jgi:hypothetical protein